MEKLRRGKKGTSSKGNPSAEESKLTALRSGMAGVDLRWKGLLSQDGLTPMDTLRDLRREYLRARQDIKSGSNTRAWAGAGAFLTMGGLVAATTMLAVGTKGVGLIVMGGVVGTAAVASYAASVADARQRRRLLAQQDKLIRGVEEGIDQLGAGRGGQSQAPGLQQAQQMPPPASQAVDGVPHSAAGAITQAPPTQMHTGRNQAAPMDDLDADDLAHEDMNVAHRSKGRGVSALGSGVHYHKYGYNGPGSLKTLQAGQTLEGELRFGKAGLELHSPSFFNGEDYVTRNESEPIAIDEESLSPDLRARLNRAKSSGQKVLIEGPSAARPGGNVKLLGRDANTSDVRSGVARGAEIGGDNVGEQDLLDEFDGIKIEEELDDELDGVERNVDNSNNPHKTAWLNKVVARLKGLPAEDLAEELSHVQAHLEDPRSMNYIMENLSLDDGTSRGLVTAVYDARIQDSRENRQAFYTGAKKLSQTEEYIKEKNLATLQHLQGAGLPTIDRDLRRVFLGQDGGRTVRGFFNIGDPNQLPAHDNIQAAAGYSVVAIPLAGIGGSHRRFGDPRADSLDQAGAIAAAGAGGLLAGTAGTRGIAAPNTPAAALTVDLPFADPGAVGGPIHVKPLNRDIRPASAALAATPAGIIVTQDMQNDAMAIAIEKCAFAEYRRTLAPAGIARKAQFLTALASSLPDTLHNDNDTVDHFMQHTPFLTNEEKQLYKLLTLVNDGRTLLNARGAGGIGNALAAGDAIPGGAIGHNQANYRGAAVALTADNYQQIKTTVNTLGLSRNALGLTEAVWMPIRNQGALCDNVSTLLRADVSDRSTTLALANLMGKFTALPANTSKQTLSALDGHPDLQAHYLMEVGAADKSKKTAVLGEMERGQPNNNFTATNEEQERRNLSDMIDRGMDANDVRPMVRLAITTDDWKRPTTVKSEGLNELIEEGVQAQVALSDQRRFDRTQAQNPSSFSWVR